MKVVTILGTRPEIIRLSRVIPRLDEHFEHILVHSGQNFDDRLSRIFFDELDVREPDIHFGIRESLPGAQIAAIIAASEQLFRDVRPDRLLILGDTNTGLSAVVAKRMGIPVFHMEAGNRCFDDRVPEEVNRRIIDHSSDVLMPYTQRSRENLLQEGIAGNRIFVTGNPIGEVLDYYRPSIEASSILEQIGLHAGAYLLATIHRAENVDVPERLLDLLGALDALASEHEMPVIVSTHPRTREKLRTLSERITEERVRFLEPFGFFDFIALEKNAHCVLTDSGTVQEECAILGTSNITVRTTTERPETIDIGSNIVSGIEISSILRAARLSTSGDQTWRLPHDYTVANVSDVVARILTMHLPGHS